MQTFRFAQLLLVLVGIDLPGTSHGGEPSLLTEDISAPKADRRRPKVELVFSLLPKSMQKEIGTPTVVEVIEDPAPATAPGAR